MHLECWAPQYKMHWHPGASPAKTHKDNYGMGAPIIRGEAERWECSTWRREGSGRILSMCANTCWEGAGKMEPNSSHWCPVKGQEATGHKLKSRKFQLDIRKKKKQTKTTYFSTVQVVKHWNSAAQRGYAISSFGDIQHPTGHVPEQPALADPALSRGVGQDNLQRCLPSSAILWFCEETEGRKRPATTYHLQYRLSFNPKVSKPPHTKHFAHTWIHQLQRQTDVAVTPWGIKS